MTVPALTEPRPAAALAVAERTLPNGLRVLAVAKPGVPLAEVRLRIPFLSAEASHPAHAALLSDTMLTGAGSLDRAGLAAAVQALGAYLNVGVDSDRLIITGNVLATALQPLLDLLRTVLIEPTYAADEVATEQERLVEKLTIARSRAGTVAAEALAVRMWGAHPYALDLPLPEAIQAATADDARALHAARVRPAGAVLVVVGDIVTDAVLDQVEATLAPWTGACPAPDVAALPTPPAGPLLIIDRPGSVQSSLRLGRMALGRSDAGFPALQLANLIFGGYFSSRWTENIREDKGYTYGPHSRIDHHVLGSTLMFDVEVATEVTGPSLLETTYELGRIASLPVTQDEVDAVRQYAIGTLALSTATQAGLASTLSALSAFGLGLDWVIDHPARLLALGVDEVSAAAARFFAPSELTGVIVGDAATITAPLAALGAVEAAG
ncbi:pitrilysin family protein [Jatrophihabitans sp.]|uniref:M16 family metallopeptidase n=1 Tax=Jatrophihabitans sp. TaxID=1932789 RepID=UPI0030C698A1|nr:peptidase M16-like [Jatrophihabitans sp.]